MLFLDSNSSLEIVTSVAGAVHYSTSAVDIAASGASPVAPTQGTISGAATTTVLAAPAASNTRKLNLLTLHNEGTAVNKVTVQKDVSAVNTVLIECDLAPHETLSYVDGVGFMVTGRNGGIKQFAAAQDTGYGSYPADMYKVGSAPEAAGVHYCWSKDSGFPGAWVIGTPGLAGRATDGTLTADAGCLQIKAASLGVNRLQKWSAVATVACSVALVDFLWVNTGIVVTTTTAQTINSVALPARDVNTASAGKGCRIGVLVTTATTNAAAITNMTVSYTNSNGLVGRTATMVSFPATAVIGTLMWFQLQAGDDGVQSIQSITLGTSLAAGAVSLIIARVIDQQSCILANAGSPPMIPLIPGIKIPNGACIFPVGRMTGTGATTLDLQAVIAEVTGGGGAD
jgi:hypothetical protein